MSYQVKQSTTAYPLVFLMIDSSDHISAKTGLTPTVTISKAGGSFASPSGAVTEIANGWYKVAGNATDSNTLGPLVLHATGTGADPVDVVFEVVAFDPQDAVRLGLTAMPNANAAANGGLPTVDANNAVKVQSGTGANQISLSSGTVTVGTNNDKTGYTASTVSDKTGYSLSSAGIQAIWDALTSALTTVGSIGKWIVDKLDVVVSTRLASSSISLSGGAVTVGTNNDKTGYSVGAGGIANTAFAAGAIDSAAIAAAAIAASEFDQTAADKVWSSAARTLTASGVQVKKNTALAGFLFFMVDSSDHVTPKTGLTITAQRSIDGAAFGSCANSASEVGSGWYKIDLANTDLNGNNIALKFTGTGADQTNILLVTNV